MPMNLALGLGLASGGKVPGGTLHYDPSLYSFADNFDSGPTSLRKRPGWQGFTPDFRIADQFAVSGGAVVTDNFGYGGDVYALTDTGRTDSLFWQGTLTAFNNGASVAIRTFDKDNYVYFQVSYPGNTNIVLGVYGIGNGAPGGSGLITQQHVNAVGDTWRFEITGDTLIAKVNGARWPDGATSWNVASALRSGKCGFGAFGGVGGTWDNVSTGYIGATPLVRLTLNPFRRLYQRNAGTTAKVISIGGTHSGLNNAPECRLLNMATGAAVTGWDWGQKPLTNFTQDASTWSAKTAAIPQGDNYAFQVRDPNNTAAGSISRKFGVGILIATYGQSNSVGMWTSAVGSAQTNAYTFIDYTSAYGGQYIAADAQFDAVPTASFGTAQIGGIVNAAAGVPVGIVIGGVGGQAIAGLNPSSSYVPSGWPKNIWNTFEDYLAAAGGDVEAFVYTQGESDAGPEGGSGLATATCNAYKALLSEMYARLQVITGRTAAQLPFLIHGLGRVSNKTNGPTTSPNWRDLRRTQYEWCRDTAGALLGSHAIDCTYRTGEDPAWHRSLDATGYGEDAKRIGAAIKKLLFGGNDRRGPVPTGIARSGSTIVVTFNANGASGMTCAAAIASNFEFGTDSTFATALTPTAMTVNSATQVTFTFGSAVPAGTSMRGPTGINPDVANALKDSSSGVMTWPVYDFMTAA